MKLEIGQQAPDFSTHDDQGKTISLKDLRGQSVVLYFYPKDDTPGCTKQACAFRDQYEEVTAQGAVVFGVSPDDQASHTAFKAKFSLPFPLLVDTDHAIAEAYGVWGERSMYGRKFMGITRSQFVIDGQGVLIDVKYAIKPDQSVPRALEALAKR